MSRTIDRAALAVTTDGVVLLNLARFDVPKRIEDLVRLALQQHGAVFIGIALSRTEAARLVAETAMVLPNVTGPVIGWRQRRTLRRRRSP